MFMCLPQDIHEFFKVSSHLQTLTENLTTDKLCLLKLDNSRLCILNEQTNKKKNWLCHK